MRLPPRAGSAMRFRALGPRRPLVSRLLGMAPQIPRKPAPRGPSSAPGMPPASERTAWDFLPEGWSIIAAASIDEGSCGHGRTEGQFIRCVAPDGFEAITKFLRFRLGPIRPSWRNPDHLTNLKISRHRQVLQNPSRILDSVRSLVAPSA